MIPARNVKTILLPPVVTTAATVIDMSFDRSGFDYCVFDLFAGTQNTATQMWTSIVVGESETVTSATSMTGIAALSGSATTSTTYNFAIPTLDASSIGSVVTLQLDLRGRKKYIGLTATAGAGGAGTAYVGAIARLSRGEESPVSATQHDGINLADTAVNGCVAIASA